MYVLSTLKDWHLWDRLKGPYKIQFQNLKESRKKREKSLRQKDSTSEEDEICSFGSFNTGFSCSTNAIKVLPCPRFKERAVQRKVSEFEQQRCLKYGSKTIVGSRTIFQLGRVRIVQAGSAQGDDAITVIRIDLVSIPSGLQISFIQGEVMCGVIREINRDRRFGFIETHKGNIFFRVKEDDDYQTELVVKFTVAVDASSSGRMRAEKIRILNAEPESTMNPVDEDCYFDGSDVRHKSEITAA